MDTDRLIESKDLPAYMEENSEGPHVAAMQIALGGWLSGNMGRPATFAINGRHVGESIAAMKSFQTAYGMGADGAFGPLTREQFERIIGFRFEEVALLLQGVTTFVQPDGTRLLWWPQQK